MVGEKENTSSNTNVKKQPACEVTSTSVPESRVKISYNSSQMLPCRYDAVHSSICYQAK